MLPSSKNATWKKSRRVDTAVLVGFSSLFPSLPCPLCTGILPHPRSPGGKPQRLTARVKIARAPVFPFSHSLVLPAGPISDLSVCLCVCRSRATSQIWVQKRRALLLRTRQPKFLHRPKRLRCDSESATLQPAGAATPQIAPPTRAPAGRRLTDARHSRHARSRSLHGHRSATVTPEVLNHSRRLASCRAPRHCRLSTPPSSRDGGVE